MQQGTTLPGDVLLITAFISYVGCFTKQFRLDLLNKLWLPFLKTLEVSKISNVDATIFAEKKSLFNLY